MAGKNRNQATQSQIIRAAARKYNVPVWILKGVKVTETGGTGSGIGEVSSADAKGPFQFIPTTASEYNVDVNDFASSAYGAAHLLSDLKKQYGSWDAALLHYSGGGYGVSTVRTNSTKLKSGNELVSYNPLKISPLYRALHGEPPLPQFPGQEQLENAGGDILKTDAGAVGLGGVVKSVEEISGFFQKASMLLFTPEGWLQIGQVTGGVILIGWGLHRLIYVSTGINPAGTVTKTASKAAEVAAVIPK